MSLRVVQLGSPRFENEGLRIGTVRRPPRGVSKSEYSSLNFYDVWLPQLSPSAELMPQARNASTPAEWNRVMRQFRKEMATPDNNHLLDMLAALSRTTSFSVGCYCEDEDRCHRSVLRELLKERGAEIVE